MLNNIPGVGPVGGLGLDGTGPANLMALNNLKYLSQGAGGAGGATMAPFNHNSLLPPGGRGPNQQSQAHQQAVVVKIPSTMVPVRGVRRLALPATER